MKKKKCKIPSWIIPILLLLFIFAYDNIIFSLNKFPIRVTGSSMLPNYENGSFEFVDTTKKIERFSVVVANPQSKYYGGVIKRVVALPGETVEVTKDAVLINGSPLDALSFYQAEEMNSQPCSYTLEEDEYFLMGDNVNASEDSRTFGPVKKEKIRGIIEK